MESRESKTKLFAFRLDKNRDAHLIEWLQEQNQHDNTASQTIRKALRELFKKEKQA